MRRCWWGLRWHPAETAVRWTGDIRPACVRHRANVELAIIESRRLKRMFEESMNRVLDTLNTPAEKVERWAKTILDDRITSV